MSAVMKVEQEDTKAETGGGERGYQCSWTGCERVYTTPGQLYSACAHIVLSSFLFQATSEHTRKHTLGNTSLDVKIVRKHSYPPML